MNCYLLWKRSTVLSFLLIFAVGCDGSQSNGWSRTGALRGPVIVYIGLRRGMSVSDGSGASADNTVYEGISVSTDHTVVRSVVPINTNTVIRHADIPDDLWQKVLTLRQEWCVQPPSHAYPTADPTRYDIVIKCDWSTPIYSIAPADMPESLTQVIALIP